MVRLRVLIVFLMATLVLSGCLSIATLNDKEINNKVFSGTIAHFDMACAHGNCIDAPFSLVVDVCLLPVTIPWSIYNVSTDSAQRYKESKKSNETFE